MLVIDSKHVDPAVLIEETKEVKKKKMKTREKIWWKFDIYKPAPRKSSLCDLQPRCE